jgi:hypothetical protein
MSQSLPAYPKIGYTASQKQLLCQGETTGSGHAPAKAARPPVSLVLDPPTAFFAATAKGFE